MSPIVCTQCGRRMSCDTLLADGRAVIWRGVTTIPEAVVCQDCYDENRRSSARLSARLLKDAVRQADLVLAEVLGYGTPTSTEEDEEDWDDEYTPPGDRGP